MFNLFAGKKKGSGVQLPSSMQNVADVMAKGSMSVRDIIAPSYVEVDFNNIKVGEKFYRTLFVVGYPRYVSANWLYSLITFDHPLFVSMFIYPTESKQVLDELTQSGVYARPIVTELQALQNYWPAEEYHQDFFARNPHQGYCLAVAVPKVAKFRKTFARLQKT